MTHYQDHSSWDYAGVSANHSLRAVGWLSREHVFDTGTVTAEFYHHLKHLFIDPWQPMIFMGLHSCELCQFDGPAGIKNLFIPSSGFLFVAPELILHYITAHHYCPPLPFQEAVLQYSSTHSIDYKKQFLENGGRHLLRPSNPT